MKLSRGLDSRTNYFFVHSPLSLSSYPPPPSFRDRDKRRTTEDTSRTPSTDVPLYTNSSLIIRLCIMGKIWRGEGRKSRSTGMSRWWMRVVSFPSNFHEYTHAHAHTYTHTRGLQGTLAKLQQFADG